MSQGLRRIRKSVFDRIRAMALHDIQKRAKQYPTFQDAVDNLDNTFLYLLNMSLACTAGILQIT